MTEPGTGGPFDDLGLVDGVEDRGVGALVGLAAGDAVGTAVEFAAPGSFEPLRDMVGGGPFRLAPGAWTDDTSMALCLAESLLDVGEMDLDDQCRRYHLWATTGRLSSTGEMFDIGITTRTQLARYARTGEAVDPAPDPDAAANGSLMRLAPVPIRFHVDAGEAAERAGESSRPTHGARRPVDACRVLGAMTAALISGTEPAEVLAPDFWRWGPLDPAVEEVARGSWACREPPQIRGSGYCVAALEAALWAVGGASDFRAAVLRAANLGDDADTTAAIAGQLAGARWGASGVPRHWRERLVLAPRIIEMARGLVRHGRADDVEAGSGRVTGSGGDVSTWLHDHVLHAWWVAPGLLAGEYPARWGDATATEHKVNLLVDAGIRTFIDLTTPDDRLEPYGSYVDAVVDERDLDVIRLAFPIPDLGVVDDGVYETILEVLDEARRRGGVFVHCWGGVGRTGTVVGAHLARSGLGADAVFARLADLRGATRKADRPCPETQPQRDVITRFASTP